jgi:hypothetical protein
MEAEERERGPLRKERKGLGNWRGSHFEISCISFFRFGFQSLNKRELQLL